MVLTRYRPEVYVPAVASWLRFSEDNEDSMDDAMRVISKSMKETNNLHEFYRVVVTWEEM